ncbi:MAG: hypothetical protein A2Y91_06605 [Chloroflexi bacterium RBG_13_54_8]|nr:MAG: hypothetical protein A2Y91_06605 [Chloroflexi bacterium RBG_13_54_8]
MRPEQETSGEEAKNAGVRQHDVRYALNLVYGPKKPSARGPAHFAGIGMVDQLRQDAIPTQSLQVPPEDGNAPPAAEIIVRAKITAPDGEEKPRREIGRMSKADRQRITGQGGPLEISLAQARFGATWSASRTVLLIPIRLTIRQVEYDATLHYKNKTQGLWIGSPLNGGDVKLAQPLAHGGFNKGDPVKLKVRGNRIQLV